MQTNWLIVADEAVAHIFQWQGTSRRLEEVETLTVFRKSLRARPPLPD